MKEFKLSRSLLSGYYVAILASFFLFQLLRDLIVTVWTVWFVSVLKALFNIDATSKGPAYISLLLICFLIVFLIRRFVIEVVDLHASNENNTNSENWVLLFLVFGFFIYTVNQVFTQPMPTEWFPEVVIKFFGGEANSLINVPATPEDKNTWTIIPWLWTIGPLAFMYVRTIASKFTDGDKG